MPSMAASLTGYRPWTPCPARGHATGVCTAVLHYSANLVTDFGGTAALYARAGHAVKIVSLTNGDAGHHEQGGGQLAMRRRAEGEAAPFVFMGVQLLHPRLFEGCIVARYSMNCLYNRALTAGRLFGLVHDGDWFHVGTPEDLAMTERLVRADGSNE